MKGIVPRTTTRIYLIGTLWHIVNGSGTDVPEINAYRYFMYPVVDRNNSLSRLELCIELAKLHDLTRILVDYFSFIVFDDDTTYTLLLLLDES